MQPIRSIPSILKDDPFKSSRLNFPLPTTSSLPNSTFPLLPLSLSMASNSLQSLHHHHHHAAARRRRHSLDASCPPALPSCLFLKSMKTTTTSNGGPFSSITFSLPSTSSSAAATATTTNPPISFELLQQHLAAQNFRQADEETRRLLILLAGEAAQKRGYVFFSEVQFISKEDLKAIDALWREHSNNRYGYSVQRRIWKKLNRDFTRFFLKVGWMKKLESTEVEQYNYKSFPDEFLWEMTDETPEGHLPLTNALRGTQLLSSILSHPAFEELEEEEQLEQQNGDGGYNGNITNTGKQDKEDVKEEKPPLSKRLFKPDYSF